METSCQHEAGILGVRNRERARDKKGDQVMSGFITPALTAMNPMYGGGGSAGQLTMQDMLMMQSQGGMMPGGMMPQGMMPQGMMPGQQGGDNMQNIFQEALQLAPTNTNVQQALGAVRDARQQIQQQVQGQDGQGGGGTAGTVADQAQLSTGAQGISGNAGRRPSRRR